MDKSQKTLWYMKQTLLKGVSTVWFCIYQALRQMSSTVGEKFRIVAVSVDWGRRWLRRYARYVYGMMSNGFYKNDWRMQDNLISATKIHNIV